MSELETRSIQLKRHAQMLAQAAAEHWSDDYSEIDESVRTILVRISEIVRGASDLALPRNPTALQILARQLLESFITLQWVISDEERAISYRRFAIDELNRVAQIAMSDGLLSVRSRTESDKDVTEEFLAGRPKPRKAPSIEEQARECGLIGYYTVFYRFMSLSVHGKSDTATDPEQREKATFADLQGVGALAQTSGHIAVRWLSHRERTDNGTIGELLGIEQGHA